jgi:hypothetical protein
MRPRSASTRRFSGNIRTAPRSNPASLCVQAPTELEVRVPADLVEGCEFVATATLHRETAQQGSVQVQVGPPKPKSARLFPDTAFLANDDTDARRRITAGFDAFRQLFPAALCYTKIVPVDEVITLILFHREDDQLKRLMLDDTQAARLDRLWADLRFVSQDALTLVDAYEQLWQYATQDADPKVLEPLRQPILDGAAAFRKALVDSEPRQLDSVIDFAARAYRRPLTDAERGELRALYRKLRERELPHDAAIRMTLARVLVAPAFLYRLEKAGPAKDAVAVSDWELATRLSYFLWSSAPDAELTAAAASGHLHEPAVLSAQMKRLLADARARRLAMEFACQWLHVRDFDTLDEKSERHFPTFLSLRGAMYEESIRFFTDFFQRTAPCSGCSTRITRS